MTAVKFGCSVRDVTEYLEVRPGGLRPSLANPLIRRIPKEETSNVGLQRLSCDADVLEDRSGSLPASIRDPFTTGRLDREDPTYEFGYPFSINCSKSRSCHHSMIHSRRARPNQKFGSYAFCELPPTQAMDAGVFFILRSILYSLNLVKGLLLQGVAELPLCLAIHSFGDWFARAASKDHSLLSHSKCRSFQVELYCKAI